MRRPLARSRVSALVITAASFAVTPLASLPPASAAAVSTGVQCAKLVAPAPVVVGGVRTRTAQLSGCSPVSATGGSGTSVTNLETLVSTTTWAGGAGTTVVKVTYKPGPTVNRCPAGSHLTIAGGKVTAGSGAALSAIKVGSTTSARWCVTAKFAVTLEPGSVQTFGGSAPTGNGNPPPPPLALPAALKDCPSGAEAAITAAVNRDRRRHGKLPPLKENANLDWAARKHSIAMGVKGYSFHDGWDTEIWESHYQLGPPGWYGNSVGWMIAPYDPDTIEAGFFDEKPPNDHHRLAILNVNYHNIGIGCIIKKSTGQTFSTQDFGS